MKKTAETSAPILSEIAERWSPRAFDPTYDLTRQELLSILEAGRWAPSASNKQPWRFSVVTRGTEIHNRISAEALGGFNGAWAPNASAIIVISVPTKNEKGDDYPIAYYDAGLASQNMMIQIQALGLAGHPISGYNLELVAEILELEEGRISIAAIVVGRSLPPETLEGPAQEREVAPRTRLPLEEIVLHGLN